MNSKRRSFNEKYVDCSKHTPRGKCRHEGCEEFMKSKGRCSKCGKTRYSNYCRKGKQGHSFWKEIKSNILS
jgi:hypothetical protein